MPQTAEQPTLTQDEAELICQAHALHHLLDDEEEVDLLEQNNPDLLTAYQALQAIALGSDA